MSASPASRMPLQALAAHAPLAAPRAWPGGRDVHVWSIDLAGSATASATASAPGLDDAEVERARRFVYADDARRYVRAHVALRNILGAYLGCDAAELRFTDDAHGKPRLCHPDTALRFNLSHSKDLALLVLGCAGELGVDVEAVRDDLPGPELAAAVLGGDELEQLACLPEGAQAQPFVACWTRKEACLKAVGLGLGLQPRSLHVGFERRRASLRVADCPLELDDLRVPAGYCAALAAVGGLGAVHAFTYDGAASLLGAGC